MSIKDTIGNSGIWQNFVDGQLPSMEVETFIADDTIYKLGITLVIVILVTVLVIRVTKPKKDN